MDAYERALAYATARGRQDGTNAAGWYELPDGSRSRYDAAALRAILDGMAEGDPAVLDTLPAPDLSGQWADSLTGPQLAADAVLAAGIDVGQGIDESDGWTADICDAYESAYVEAVEAEVSRRIRYQLRPNR